MELNTTPPEATPRRRGRQANPVLSAAQQDVIDARREQVATLRLRRCSVREIVARLAADGLTNPDTQEPYSVGTIHADLKALAGEWRASARRKTADHRDEQLAVLMQVQRVAWREAEQPGGAVIAGLLKALQDDDPAVRAAAAKSLGLVAVPDLDVVLKAADQIANLTGTPLPRQVDVQSGGQPFAPTIREVIIQISQPVLDEPLVAGE